MEADRTVPEIRFQQSPAQALLQQSFNLMLKVIRNATTDFLHCFCQAMAFAHRIVKFYSVFAVSPGDTLTNEASSTKTGMGKKPIMG